MEGHEFCPLVRGQGGVPPLLAGREARVEIAVALREVRGIRGRELTEFVSDRLRDPPPVARLEPVVGVAERMDVAHRPRDLPRRELENLYIQRGVEIPVRAKLN